MPSALLDDRGVIRVSGDDARAFLQGLFTCDMDKVSPGHAAYGALLTPQGKIICDFFVAEIDLEAGPATYPNGSGFLIDAPLTHAPALAARLKMYKLRSRVTIAHLDGKDPPIAGPGVVVALWGGERPRRKGSVDFVDPRAPGMGIRSIQIEGEAITGFGEGNTGELAAYEAHRISLGVPSGGVDFAYGDAFPHEANLDLLNGVDFKKGCYVGQEVVSRVEHRGTARKRIARVTFDGPAPPAGSPLMVGDIEIGAMGSASTGQGLAMVRIDRVKDAVDTGLAITVDGRAVTLALPVARH